MCSLGAPLCCEDGGRFAIDLAERLWGACLYSAIDTNWHLTQDALGEMLAHLMGALSKDVASAGNGEKDAVKLLCAATFGTICMGDTQLFARRCVWVSMSDDSVQALWARVSSVEAVLEYCGALDKIQPAINQLKVNGSMGGPDSVTAFCPLDQDNALRTCFLEKVGALLRADAAAHVGYQGATTVGAEADVKKLASFVTTRLGGNVHALDHTSGSAAAATVRAAQLWVESRGVATATEATVEDSECSLLDFLAALDYEECKQGTKRQRV
mmetsp:Transcript_31028/g.62065  ORF Transcript_31028/g.62065 Transcript_31028/m.62065 type:complete len:270 (-) Transcript_31028:60-869(-)